MIKLPIDVNDWFGSLPGSIVELYRGGFKPKDLSLLTKTLDELLISNFMLWGYEDEARRKDLPDKAIADLKRNIDTENQKRNDLIDKIDAILEQEIKKTLKSIDTKLPFNTETPGSVFDRLAVLGLRTHNLKREIERKGVTVPHIERCKNMTKEVQERSKDLLKCLEDLLEDYYSGRKRLKSYKQHKLYNDPDLNPSLRKES